MVAASALPYKFTTPWAALSSGLTNPIPPTAAGASASQQQGFPLLTATSVAAGGTPPAWADFNGALFYATSWLQWLQAGGAVAWDATFSTAIGGYPAGARIRQAANPLNDWISTADNNASDPDTGGANWADPFKATLAMPGGQALPSGLSFQWASVPSGTLSPGQTSTVQVISASFPTGVLAVFPNGGAVGAGAAVGVFVVGANISGGNLVEYIVTNTSAVTGATTIMFLFVGH